MNCELRVGPRVWRFARARQSRFGLLLLVVCVIMVGGCASTAAVERTGARASKGLANAFSRAMSFATEKESVSRTRPHQEKLTYPSLPNDSDDPRVRRFIRHYAYEQRETTKKYLARAERYLPMVRQVCRDQNLPEDIAYLFMLESGANPEARSPANALGMWQFMPATARSYGLRVDSCVDERLDPRKSTKAAMLYLKDLYGMFGCWRLALSAYNSGENKLNKVLCAEDASEYDEICSSKRLKRETREFFPRFQALAMIARNPRKFGFAPLNQRGTQDQFELVSVDGGYALKDLAWAIGVPFNRLTGMNPGLFRGITPAAGPPIKLRVPRGRKELLASKLNDVPQMGGKQHIVHVVHRGDNLATILKRYQISKTQLAKLNPDVNLRRSLRRGAKLIVPVSEKAGAKKSRKPERLSLLR